MRVLTRTLLCCSRHAVRLRRHARVALLVLLTTAGGCVHPTQRTGPSLVLGDSAPGSSCERERWVELAPARSRSTELEVVEGEGRAREATGLALFDTSNHAVDLRKLVPSMAEPSLELPLRMHVEPVHAKLRESAYWLLGGASAMGAGIGYAATGGKALRADHIAALSAGLVLGLAAAIVSWVRMPRRSDRMEADLRRTMFVEGEYDREAVRRGALRVREHVRVSCGRPDTHQ